MPSMLLGLLNSSDFARQHQRQVIRIQEGLRVRPVLLPLERRNRNSGCPR